MMEELYGFPPTDDYSRAEQEEQLPPSMAPPGNYISPATYHAFTLPSTAASFGRRNPMVGADPMFSGSSSVSDGASMVAGIGRGSSEEDISSAIRAKIASHPLYPKLLEAYIDCQKVGAPPEIACVLDEILQECDVVCKSSTVVSSCLGADPELDHFMETYCDVLAKYKSDLSRPFHEATSFLNHIQTQLTNLCNAPSRTYLSDEAGGSSEEDFSGGEVEVQASPRTNEGRELKDKLLRKYSGYISTLKHEFSKKKKKGKLPREARQILLDWWNIHYKWPYPTEADKVALTESTGLDQKQINNWFINQRKRHWKPSDNMQFAVMDSLYGPFFMNA